MCEQLNLIQCFFENVEGHINRDRISPPRLGRRRLRFNVGEYSQRRSWRTSQRKRIFILANASGYALRKQSEGEQEEHGQVRHSLESMAKARSVAKPRLFTATAIAEERGQNEWGWTGDGGQRRNYGRRPTAAERAWNQPKGLGRGAD